jgi:signal transduction histidine kinase
MLERDFSPEQYRKSVSAMLEISVELSSLVEHLLTLARSDQPLVLHEIDLAAVAREASQGQLESAKARGMKLELELSPVLGRGDFFSLRLVATNLISNAVRYGREGGTIWVRTTCDQTQAILEVDDDGDGIPTKDLERLQQPFQRGHDKQGQLGFGLGLALVKAIVEQHGGRLGLSRASQFGGLKARVTLPL